MVEELVLCQLRRFNLKTKEAFIWMKSGLVLDESPGTSYTIPPS
jgi:hypothetical protein